MRRNPGGEAKAIFHNSQRAGACLILEALLWRKTVEEATYRLRDRYKNREKNSAYQANGKKYDLLGKRKDDPNSSEMAIVQYFVSRPIGMQGKLSASYQGGRYRRDRLQETIAIPTVQAFWNTGRPRFSSPNQHGRERLANRPKTAGDVSANCTLPKCKVHDSADVYGLGQTYGGSAVQTVI